MDEKRFEELIKRCLSGQATKKEAARVEKWLDHRSEKDPFGKLSFNERAEIKIKILKELSSKLNSADERLRRAGRGRAIAFYWSAAALVLISVLSYAVLQFTPRSSSEKITVQHALPSAGVTRKVILSDSSIVWLKGNSSIFYPEKFNGPERNVKLIGEALFEVAKDPDHPFVIQCGGLMAKVLGTSFNIKSSKIQIEVLVLTGKVALSSKGNRKALIVHSNEKAVYNKSQNQMEKVISKDNEKTDKIKGTEYSMRFDATDMKEIIRRIEGKFNVKISLSDERLSNCTLTADFTDQSLDRTLSMISQSLEIEYERNNNHVTLKGAGCDYRIID